MTEKEKGCNMESIAGKGFFIQPFDNSKCTWNVYVQVFINVMKVNDVPEAKWVQYLLSCVGFEIVTLLTELCYPEEVEKKTFKQLVDQVTNHINPEPSEIAETFKFMQRSQREGESIMEYVAALKCLARTCKFGTFLERALRDKFVHDLRSEAVVRKLFSEKDLSFNKAVLMAQGMEVADKEAKLVAGSSSLMTQKIEKYTGHRQKKMSNNATMKLKCHCCGALGHIKPKCRYKDEECHNCKKKGHLKSVCTFNKKKVKEIKEEKVSVGDQSEFAVLKVECCEENEDYGLKHLFKEEGSVSIIQNITTIREDKPKPWEVMLIIEQVKITFEIDCGSDVTLIPFQQCKQLLPGLKIEDCKLKLLGYGGRNITVIGKAKVTVNHNGKSYCAPLIIVKEGNRPLLGRDWLNVMKIDWQRVYKNCNYLTKFNRIDQLVATYYDIFSGSAGEIKGPPGKLKLKNTAVPKVFKPRRVPYALENVIKSELNKLVQEGKMYKISCKDNIKWATPIVPIVKGPHNVRICGDYKITINPHLEVPQHPIPVIEDIFAKLNKDDNCPKRVFSKIDLRKAYMNRKMDVEAQELMTLTTPWGLFRPTFMMFGMAPAPLEWQDFMDEHFNMPNVYTYLDDILVATATEEENLIILEKIFEKLRELNIKVNKEKTVLLSSKLEYCGHIIDCKGIHKTPDHIKAILEAPEPKNVKELQSFLGAVNFYHKFLKDAASYLKPLYRLLRASEKWNWDKPQIKAYQWAKQAIASNQVLMPYNPKLPVILSCDASKYGLGACLAHEVKQDGKLVERPIAFASRTLSDAEVKYSQIDKEALSIIWAVKKFDLYLKGRTFTLVTDHKPLVSIFNPNKSAGNIYADRMARWSLILCNYNYNIKYRASQHNVTADFPSRLPLPNTEENNMTNEEECMVNSIMLENPPITLTEINKATQKDYILSKIYTYLQNGWPKQVEDQLLVYKGKQRELYVYKGCVLWRGRLVIPKSLRAQLLEELHSGHLGGTKMQGLCKDYFWWPKISKDIEAITQHCKACVQNKNMTTKKPVHNWEWPNEPWKRIHADFAGPFLGFMWLIVVDAHSKWPEIVKMNVTTSDVTIGSLRSIFARFGLPEQLVTDNGPQWTSEAFANFCKLYNIRHIFTAPYHPASNGLAERAVQTFKKAMSAGQFNKSNLDYSLQNWLLAYRTAPHATTGKAPCELMFGRQLRTRLSIIRNEVMIPRQCIVKKPVKQYMPGELVHVASYNQSRKWLDGTVVKPVGNVMYEVQTDKGIITRNVTQCLPRNQESPVKESREIPSEREGNISSNDSNSTTKDLVGLSETPNSVSEPVEQLRRSARIPKPRNILDL